MKRMPGSKNSYKQKKLPFQEGGHVRNEPVGCEESNGAIADAAFEGVVIHINGLMVEVNAAFLELTGYRKDEILGKSVFDIFTPESKRTSVEIVRRGSP